jgi:putative mRNA 3-end processing factor
VTDLLQVDERGIACGRGAFHVDPWAPTETAVLTHAHSDHARPGMGVYHCTASGAAIVRKRLGAEARIVPHEFGERFALGDATVSLHPAGHVLGSSQVRVEVDSEVWVVSGDYKRAEDPTTRAFEVVPCDVFVSEATFALPIYRWPEPEEEIDRLVDAWKGAAEAGRPTVLFAYSLGKAQRVLSLLARRGDLVGPILTHGAVEGINALYRDAGVALPETSLAASLPKRASTAGALIVAPPSTAGSPFIKRFTGATHAFASGWMRLRGPRRRRAIDLGVVISDHADWPALLSTIAETGAKRIRLTHGHSLPLSRHLREEGLDAKVLETRWIGEPQEAG